eukprot:TRINITY_DN61710_c0_g1_i1.p1 TRINITY_DN61710_c0_g1~~TRINITY_DN61710_c0_g1_i1.p1  ORF type:complete len:314 (-),score=35.91 TRINITY_DN61710_c0_g1_i1:31-972(-)
MAATRLASLAGLLLLSRQSITALSPRPGLHLSRPAKRLRGRCFCAQGQGADVASKFPYGEPKTHQDRFEVKLWAAWRNCTSPRPVAKEIRECLAVHRETNKLLGRRELLVDVGGGHGGLALSFRASHHTKRAIVADIFKPDSFDNLRRAWSFDQDSEADVEHRHTDLRDRQWLQRLISEEQVDPADVAVIGCHTCGVLADELISTCLEARVSFAIMPCCHGEQGVRGDNIKSISSEFGVPQDSAYDMMRLGSIDAAPGYIARLRKIDSSITPRNHILIGVRAAEKEALRWQAARDGALNRLAAAYKKQLGTAL